MQENTDEALRQWQAIGQRVKRVRQSMGMSPMMFAQELGTSSLNINLIENLSKCDMTLLRDINMLADEMRWQALLKHVSHKFKTSEEWLMTGAKNETIKFLGMDDPRELEHEIVITVPLMIGQATLLEVLGMIVNNSNGNRFGNNEYHMIDKCLHHILSDLIRLYCQGMSKTGRSDIAEQTIEAMMNLMKRHSYYRDSGYSTKRGKDC